ncbi:MAG: hypothetical protein N2Z69_05995, partial [Methylophilaceae bacterium]|nr:hypothetical protein [Methylophilaceae bacterium]
MHMVYISDRWCSAHSAHRTVFFCVTLLLTHTVYAARPMITDDARIVDAKACQLESWVKKN